MLAFWRRNPPGRDHLFLACFPKSGSTYLATALQALTGRARGFSHEHAGHNEQDISARKLRKIRRPAVIHEHVKGTENNVRTLQQFGIRPIVHVRNIFDVVVSIYDHLKQEDHRVPTGYVHREYWSLSFDEQLDYLIYVHLPWYFNFLVSWHEASEQIPVFYSCYESLMADRAGTIRRIADFYRLSVSDAEIASALASADMQNTRLNRGVSGRGLEVLRPHHIAAIHKLASVWKVDDVVLSTLGISFDRVLSA